MPTVPRRTARRGRIQWIISALVAATVGVASFSVGGSEYGATVDVTVTDPTVSGPVLDGLRRDLLDHAWRTLGAAGARWRVDLDEAARTLRVTTTSPDPGEARAVITRAIGAFLDHIRTVVDRAHSQPGPDERALAEFRDRLRAELDTLTGDMRRIQSLLLRVDSEAENERLCREVADRHADYVRNRERVSGAEAALAALLAAPLPERAAVNPEVRAGAIHSDLAVQQDFKALRVQLADVRHQLLKVYEAAKPALDELVTSAGRFVTLCAREPARSTTVELRRAVERMGRSGADYRALLDEFSQAWLEHFNHLRSLEGDPRRPKVIDVQAALNETSSGFTFRAAQPLAAIREEVRSISTAPAVHHELVSSVVRSFHALQTAHHRFEFAASDVKSSNNFRLDAALQSAKGLRRRSRERVARIDEQLSRQALADLRAQRERRIAALRDEIDELRPALDASVDALFGARDRADEHTPALQDFRQSKLLAGVYEDRIGALEHELQRIDARLSSLAAKRMNVINPDHLEVALCRVDRWPTNLLTKLVRGVLAAFAVFVVLLGLHSWLSPMTLEP